MTVSALAGRVAGVEAGLGCAFSVFTMSLGRATMGNIPSEPLAYNAIGIPIAAGVLYSFLGLRLSPIIAAAARALSSLSVVGNASRLRHYHPPGIRPGQAGTQPDTSPSATAIATPISEPDDRPAPVAASSDRSSSP